jgi:Fibronectin type III domain
MPTGATWLVGNRQYSSVSRVHLGYAWSEARSVPGGAEGGAKMGDPRSAFRLCIGRRGCCIAVLLGVPFVAAAASEAGAVRPHMDHPMASAATSAQARRAAASSDHRVLVRSELSKSTVTWANPNGTMTARIYAGPIQEPDRHSETGFAPVDSNLERAGDELKPVRTDAHIRFSDGGRGPAVRMVIGKGNVAISAAASLPRPTVTRNSAAYAISRAVDLVLRATSTGFDLNLILRHRPPPGFTYRLPFRLRGIRTTLSRTGRLTFEASGHVVAMSDPVEMWGAARNRRGDPIEEARPSVRLVGSVSAPELVIAPSRRFLTDPNVNYPVTIDPTSDLSVGVDTYVDQAHPTATFVNNSELRSGLQATGQIQRSLLSFDASALNGDTINSATLNLFETLSGSCTATAVQVWSLAGSWSGSTTWNTQPTKGQEWASANTGVGFGGACPQNWVQFSTGGTGGQTLTNLVQDWTNGTATNHGLEVVAGSETSGSAYKRFNSADNTSDQPYLEVNYSTTTTVTPPTVSGGSTAWQSVSSVTFIASGSTTTGGATVTGYNYRTSTDGGSSWSAPAAATSGSAAVSAEGTTLIQFQAVDSTGNTSTWAPASAGAGNTAKIDRTAPTSPTVSGGSATWQNAASVAVSGSGSTDSLSGVDHYQFRESTDAGATWSSPTTGSSDTVTRTGQTLVQFRAVDAAGNDSSWAPTTAGAANTVELDRTAPTTPTVSGGSTTWQNAASVTISGSGSTDDLSGIDHYNYRTSTDGGGSWSSPTVGASDTVTAEGSTLVQFQAVDGAGNASAWAPAAATAGNTVKLDRTAPTTPTVTGGSSAWQDVSSVDVTASSTDGGSGVDHYNFETSSDSGSTWSDPASGNTATVSTTGETLVRFEAVDGAGNVSAWGPTTNGAGNTVRIDHGPSLLSLSEASAANGSYLTDSPLTVSWTPDSGDTIDGYSVVVDTSAGTDAPQTVSTTDTSMTVTATSPGTEYFHIRADDGNGIWSPTQTQELTFAAQIVSQPADGLSLDGTSALSLELQSDPSTYVCWEYGTPATDSWTPVPAGDVTISGSPISGWPTAVGSGADVVWEWSDWTTAPGIDGWPGEVNLRAVTVPSSSSSCGDSSAATVYSPSIRFDPATGGTGGAMRRASRRSGPATPMILPGASNAGGGGTIFYGTDDEDFAVNNYVLANWDGSDQSVVASPNSRTTGGISADGTVLAYDDTGEIAVQTQGGTTDYPLPDGQHLEWVSVSPDGESIAYLVSDPSDGDKIYVSPATHFDPELITSTGYFKLSAPTFTAHSNEVMYGTPATGSDPGCMDIEVAPVDSSDTSLPSGVVDNNAPCIEDDPIATESPNSEFLAVQSGTSSVDVFSSDSDTILSDLVAEDGSATPTYTLTGSNLPALANTSGFWELSAWSPDSSQVLIANADDAGNTEIYAVDPVEAQSHLLYTSASSSDYLVRVEPLGWAGLPTNDAKLALMYRPEITFGDDGSTTEHFFPMAPDDLLSELGSGGQTLSKIVEWYKSDNLGLSAQEALPMTLAGTGDSPGSMTWWEYEFANATDPSSPGPGWAKAPGATPQLDVNGGASSGPDQGTSVSSYPEGDSSCDTACGGSIYDNVTTVGDVTYIQYWIFYRFNDIHKVNDWEAGCLVEPAACDEHQGDWEGLELALDHWGAVEWVAMSQHTQWSVYYNSPNELDNPGFISNGAGFYAHTHLYDYVAVGTHSNYPLPCDHESECFSPVVTGSLASFTVDGLGDDDHNGAIQWSGNDPAGCAESCVEALGSQDFMADSFWRNLIWGVDPPLPPTLDQLSGAPGGPDSPNGSHSSIYEDPTSTALLTPGNLVQEYQSDIYAP